MFFPLSFFRHLHEHQFVQKSFDLILLINNYYFEQLPIKYMHKWFTVLLWKFETALSKIFRSQKNDWRFRQQMQYIAHKLSYRPSLHLPNSILKTLQIYYLNQNLLCVFCIFVCLHILDCQKNSALLDSQYSTVKHHTLFIDFYLNKIISLY